jgi:hypothetical protein
LIVPAGAALAGVALGKLWDSLLAGAAWKRERRGSAYASFIAALESAYIEMSQITEDFSVVKVDECVREATRCGAIVDMFASEDVARAAHRVWNFVALELNAHDVKKMSVEEWAPLSNTFRSLIEAFRDAARCELGEKPLRVRTSELDAKEPTRSAVDAARSTTV